MEKEKHIFHTFHFIRLIEYFLHMSRRYIPLTNRVGGPYRKLRTEFFPPRFMAQARSARAITSKGKKRGSVTYSKDRENEFIKIFIIYLVCVLFTRNGFKFLKHLESKTSQFEIVFKPLALFNT